MNNAENTSLTFTGYSFHPPFPSSLHFFVAHRPLASLFLCTLNSLFFSLFIQYILKLSNPRSVKQR